jgi:hypothetical protein
MTASQIRYLAIILFACITVISCRGVNDDGSSGSTGELTLGITDGPADGVDEVRVVFSGIEITPQSGSPILVEDLEEDFIELVQLQGGVRELLLSDFDLADGSYQSVRLIFEPIGSFVRVDGSQFDLVVPSAEEARLRIDVNLFFDPDNDEEDITIDIDLRKSLCFNDSQSPAVYELHPSMRVVETAQSETLRGTVAAELIEATTCANDNNNEDGNAVYLFVGNSGAAQDIQGNSGDPFATATVSFNNTNSQWEFAFGFLPRQSYRAAFTCDSILDDPDADNSGTVEFAGPITVDVQQGNTETLRFE